MPQLCAPKAPRGFAVGALRHHPEQRSGSPEGGRLLRSHAALRKAGPPTCPSPRRAAGHQNIPTPPLSPDPGH
eukprot:3369182-Pyramimonas_sp.AAC.1